jgi:hypothetical protein
MRPQCAHPARRKLLYLRGVVLFGLLLPTGRAAVGEGMIYAQVTPPITSSGLSTQICGPTTLPNGQINDNISGRTKPGNGANLSHSFGNFNIANHNIVNFLNDSGLLHPTCSVAAPAETFRISLAQNKPPALSRTL